MPLLTLYIIKHKLKPKLQCSRLQLYPLWLCPFVLPNNLGFVHPKDNSKPQMYVDIGAYGAPKVNNFNAVETTRCLEKFVTEHNGYVLAEYCRGDLYHMWLFMYNFHYMTLVTV